MHSEASSQNHTETLDRWWGSGGQHEFRGQDSMSLTGHVTGSDPVVLTEVKQIGAVAE